MKRETHRHTIKTDKKTTQNRTGVWLDAKAVKEDDEGSPLHHSPAWVRVIDRIATDMGHEGWRTCAHCSFSWEVLAPR